MQSMNFCYVTGGGFILQTHLKKVKNHILSKLKRVWDANLRKYLQAKNNKVTVKPPLSSRSVSDILTVTSLITPGDPVTGGMQTLSFLSVNSLMRQAQQILVEVKDIIQKATNTARVQRGQPEPRCRQPEREWNVIFWLMTKVRPSLCDPIVFQIRPICSILLRLPATRSKYDSDNQSHISAPGRDAFGKQRWRSR